MKSKELHTQIYFFVYISEQLVLLTTADLGSLSLRSCDVSIEAAEHYDSGSLKQRLLDLHTTVSCPKGNLVPQAFCAYLA